MEFFISPLQKYCILKVSELDNVLQASCQRLVDEQRVNDMCSAILSSLQDNKQPFLPQCICIVENIHTHTRYIIDGQHRLSAYKRLLTEHGHDFSICVNIIQVDTDQQVTHLFNLVNTSVPVPNLPDGITFNQVNSIVETFINRYPSIFKTSKKRTNRPFINVNTFTEHMATLLSNGWNADKIIQTIDTFNQSGHSMNWNPYKDIKYEWFKQVHGFYMALIKPDEWGSLVFQIHDQLQFKVKRRGIPQALRVAVWNRYIGQTQRTGKCPFCQDEICLENFHCAHDLAAALRGQETIDNLFPACGKCNTSQGIESFTEFLSRFTQS